MSEPRGCPTPGACSAEKRTAALEAENAELRHKQSPEPLDLAIAICLVVGRLREQARRRRPGGDAIR